MEKDSLLYRFFRSIIRIALAIGAFTVVMYVVFVGYMYLEGYSRAKHMETIRITAPNR